MNSAGCRQEALLGLPPQFLGGGDISRLTGFDQGDETRSPAVAA
jgi:hypothetical protein